MTRSLLGMAVRGCAVGCLTSQALAAEPGPLDRTILPIREPARPLYTELDARNVTVPPRFEVKAPEGAPNVVIVLIDDLGFGVPTTFGGPVSMPTLDQLAQDGLRYSNFHTTALCSPTRAALKSGRNHHTVNIAFITEMATGLPWRATASRRRRRPHTATRSTARSLAAARSGCRCQTSIAASCRWTTA